MSPEQIQKFIEREIRFNQVKVAKAVGDFNGDKQLSQ